MNGLLCSFLSVTLAAWKQVFDKVQEARIDRHLKLVPFAGSLLSLCFTASNVWFISLMQAQTNSKKVFARCVHAKMQPMIIVFF